MGCAWLGRRYVRRSSVDGDAPWTIDAWIRRKPTRWRCDLMEREPSWAVGACVPALGYSHREDRWHALAWSGQPAISVTIVVASPRRRSVYSGSAAETACPNKRKSGGHWRKAC